MEFWQHCRSRFWDCSNTGECLSLCYAKNGSICRKQRNFVGKQKLQPVRNTEYLPCIHRERSDKKKWQFLMEIRNFPRKGSYPSLWFRYPRTCVRHSTSRKPMQTGCSSWKLRKRIYCMIGVMYLRISITSIRTGQKKRIFYQN